MHRPEQHQTSLFVGESMRFVSTHLNSFREVITIPESINVDTGEASHLDVGCGNGDFLRHWSDHFGTTRSVGVEPSAEAVALLNQKHRNSRLSFVVASAERLPFAQGEFDIVTACGVIDWLGRDDYLAALGELVRVTRKYLVVEDFVCGEDYRTPYRHKPGLYTYKTDFEPPIRASGIMRPIESQRWWRDPESGLLEIITEANVAVARGNKAAYHARKLVVFEKDYDTLPVRLPEYFIDS